MRRILFCSAVLAAAAAVAAMNARPASAVDEHAGHGGDDVGGVWGPAPQVEGIPASGTNAAARIAASPRRAEWVTIKVGPTDSVTAWVVYPQTTAKAPVVIAIHENTGLTTWARGVADQLAADGFIGIAPDLITMKRSGDLRREWSSDSGRAAIGTLSNDDAQRLLDGVARYGMALPQALPTYGVVGFCWGGARSFLHAVHSPTLGAAVVYYGTSPSAEQLAAIKAPVLGLYGGNDARVNATIAPADSAMKRLGKTFEYSIFDGAGHGFLRGQEGANGANMKASQEAWPKTIAWFNRHLKK
jgi:carboxymethylenebutenolidase